MALCRQRLHEIAKDREALQKERFVASRVIRRRYVVLSTLFFSPSFSGLSRGKEPICTDRIILVSFFFLVSSLASPTPRFYRSPSLFFLFLFFYPNTRRLLARIQGGRCTRARGKTWRRPCTSLERVLKTAVGEEEEEEEKGAKEGEGCERAGTG